MIEALDHLVLKVRSMDESDVVGLPRSGGIVDEPSNEGGLAVARLSP